MSLPKEYSGSIASLRTFRVLRALKTVAVVPGMYVIIIKHFDLLICADKKTILRDTAPDRARSFQTPRICHIL